MMRWSIDMGHFYDRMRNFQVLRKVAEFASYRFFWFCSRDLIIRFSACNCSQALLQCTTYPQSPLSVPVSCWRRKSPVPGILAADRAGAIMDKSEHRLEPKNAALFTTRIRPLTGDCSFWNRISIFTRSMDRFAV